MLGLLHKELDTYTEVEYIDNPWAFYQNHTEADIKATRKVLGYEPLFNIEKGIAAYAPAIKAIYEKELA